VSPSPALSLRLLSLSLLTLLSAACRREEVAQYQAPKETPGPAAMPNHPPTGMPANPQSGMPAMDPNAVPPPAAAPGEGALKWTLPKGWTEERGSGMRYATFKPGIPGKVDISVVVLPGAAGGELANVNRWRGQIGLGAVDEAGMAKFRTAIKAKAGAVALVDFTSEGQNRTRMLAAQLSVKDGNTWFIKVVGDAEPVGKVRPELIRLLESLRVD